MIELFIAQEQAQIFFPGIDDAIYDGIIEGTIMDESMQDQGVVDGTLHSLATQSKWLCEDLGQEPCPNSEVLTPDCGCIDRPQTSTSDHYPTIPNPVEVPDYNPPYIW